MTLVTRVSRVCVLWQTLGAAAEPDLGREPRAVRCRGGGEGEAGTPDEVWHRCFAFVEAPSDLAHLEMTNQVAAGVVQ